MSTTASHNAKLEALERLCAEQPKQYEAVWAFCKMIRQERMQSPTLSQSSAAKLEHFYHNLIED